MSRPRLTLAAVCIVLLPSVVQWLSALAADGNQPLRVSSFEVPGVSSSVHYQKTRGSQVQ